MIIQVVHYPPLFFHCTGEGRAGVATVACGAAQCFCCCCFYPFPRAGTSGIRLDSKTNYILMYLNCCCLLVQIPIGMIVAPLSPSLYILYMKHDRTQQVGLTLLSYNIIPQEFVTLFILNCTYVCWSLWGEGAGDTALRSGGPGPRSFTLRPHPPSPPNQ